MTVQRYEIRGPNKSFLGIKYSYQVWSTLESENSKPYHVGDYTTLAEAKHMVEHYLIGPIQQGEVVKVYKV